MIDINSLLGYYPEAVATNKAFHKHILKEYVELLALEHLSRSPLVAKIVFIGGTNLRLVHGIDRFSEDLEFDCKGLTETEFVELSDEVTKCLRNNGLQVELRDKDTSHLTAFRRNLYFPELLFEMGLTGHREERFLMKIEAQDQGVDYQSQMALINRCGFLFPMPVAPKEVLLSMKLLALLTRGKGRDFYDTIFLWQQTSPDYDLLGDRCGIGTPEALREALEEKLSSTDLKLKQRDFEHLLFNTIRSTQILYFREFIEGKLSTTTPSARWW